MHVEEEEAPALGLYVPCTQNVGFCMPELGQNDPFGQYLHNVEPLWSLNWPGSHGIDDFIPIEGQ